MDTNQLKTLAFAAVKQTPLTFSHNGKEETFNVETVNETLRKEFDMLVLSVATRT